MSNSPIDKINQNLSQAHQKSSKPAPEHSLPATNNTTELHKSYLCQWLNCKIGVIITLLSAGFIFVLCAFLIANYAFDQTINRYLTQNHAISVQIALEGKDALKTFQKNAPSIKNIQSIATLQRDLADYKDVTDKKYDMIYNMLSNSLTIVTIIIAVFGLLLGLFGFYLAAYISKKYEDISGLKNDAHGLNSNILAINQIVDENYEKVIDFFEKKESELYKIMEDHDTALILKRLKKSPEFMIHALPILLVREQDGIWENVYNLYDEYLNTARIPSGGVARYYFLFLLAKNSSRFFTNTELLDELVESSDCTKYIIDNMTFFSATQIISLLQSANTISEQYKDKISPFIQQTLAHFTVIVSLLQLDSLASTEILRRIKSKYKKNIFDQFNIKVHSLIQSNKPRSDTVTILESFLKITEEKTSVKRAATTE